MSYINKLSLKFSAKNENEAFARLAVASFCSVRLKSLESISDIKTVVSEAVTNAIVHGYENKDGEVIINCEITKLKRVYFGDIKKFGELDHYSYFCDKSIIDEMDSNSPVVVSRDGFTIYPLNNKNKMHNIAPNYRIDVISQDELDMVEDISIYSRLGSFVKYLSDGAKKLVSENPEIIRDITSQADSDNEDSIIM